MPVEQFVLLEIMRDFGAVPALLPITVYQLSAAVGRSFPRSVTLEIT